MIYGHGDDSYNFDDIRINFSSNVNPLGINEGLKAHLNSCLNRLGSYPEPLANCLARTIEQQKELSMGSVLITNGAVEAIYLLASLFQKKKSLIYTPSFSEYEDACRMYNHDIIFCSNLQFPKKIGSDIDIVWICNPNNPDGSVFNKEILKEQITQHSNTLFIIDEAYADFINDDISLIKEATQLPNLVVIRSLTKRFAIPALRLGYLVCAPKIMGKVKQMLMPWRINELAIEAGLYCSSEKYVDSFSLAEFLLESQRFQYEINQLNNFEVIPSPSSFFLVESNIPATTIKTELIKHHGILIRDASNFRGLSPYHFRLSTQSAGANNKLITILKTWNF